MIRLGILTSSRADFGYYLPLLNVLKSASSFSIEIIAFGTHLSKYHGYTIAEIEKNGFQVKFKISSLLLTDDNLSIADAYALTALKFSDFWLNNQYSFDLVVCIGDRFEMAAAVTAAIPFGIKFLHIGGGDTTMGAFDNIYRHQITLASDSHIVLLPQHRERVRQIVGYSCDCLVSGALSLENLKHMHLLSVQEFKEKWNIDLIKPTILLTVHPETISYSNNQIFANQLFEACVILAKSWQFIVTLPNADTMGTIYRGKLIELQEMFSENIFIVESLGTQGYFTCMNYCGLVLGNSSSGILEAATFGKYVINLGERQKGRLSGGNVITVSFDSNRIIESCQLYFGKKYHGENIYCQKEPLKKIIEFLNRYNANV